MAVSGLYLGIFLYYSKRLPWSPIGVVILTLTAFCLAYSLKYLHPTTLSALNITRKRAGLYILVGLLVIMPGWFFDSLASYLSGRGWWSFGIAKSPPLIISILIVAISEELFFRGYVQGRLKSLGGNRWMRIATVSAIFMFYKVVVHAWDGWAFATYAGFFAFGATEMLFETFWVDWTGSIVTSIRVIAQ
ncbi:MAG: CPBP family intramembrane metalloprotease [Anaerolineae bacterium]|nr:CPBP family intramembrane metalloprotease [Anaerolineae bacterium]